MGKQDLGAKTLYSNPDIVKDLLRLILKESVSLINLDSLQVLRTDHIHSRDQASRNNDILWVVERTDGIELYLPIMIEHQSDSDSLMALRINTYISLTLEGIIRNKSLRYVDEAARLRVPLVLPIVIYNGDSKWSAATSLEQMRDPFFTGELVPEPSADSANAITKTIDGLQPNCGYYLIDVKRLVAKLDGPTQENLAELIFKLEFNQGVDEIVALLQTVIKMTDSDVFAGVRAAITSWLRNTLNDKYLKNTGTEIPDMEDLMELKDYAEERTLTWPEMYFRNGKLEGIAEGEAKGQASLLLGMLKQKFTYLPDQVIDTVKSGTLEQIQAWSLRLLDAKTLDEIFD